MDTEAEDDTINQPEALVAAAYRAAEGVCDELKTMDIGDKSFGPAFASLPMVEALNMAKDSIRNLTPDDATNKLRELCLEVGSKAYRSNGDIRSIVNEVLGK